MGYAKICRDITDNKIFYDDKLLAFYVRLLLLSRYKSCVKKGITVNRGQLFMSIRELAAVLNLKPTNTLKLLNSLEREQIISIEKYSRGCLITLNDYDSNSRKKENREQQKKCSREHFANTFDEATLLYNNSKNVKKCVAARREKSELENENDNFVEDSKQQPAEPERHFEPPTREKLVEKYGEENVSEYETRFELWRSRQESRVNIGCYEAISRWMFDDGVVKAVKKDERRSEAAYSTDAIMQRILDSYNT